jgi:cytoskeletal protein CcmA (bactofilin family)
MSLLRSSAPPDDAPRGGANPAEQHNIIGKGTVLEGTVRSAGNVHVSGTVLGKLEVEGRTVVMPGGVIEGELASTSAEVGGRVKGEIRVRERLVLKATAVVEGDIHTQKLVIEEGAVFTGRCEMGANLAAPGRGDRAEGTRPTRRLGGEDVAAPAQA